MITHDGGSRTYTILGDQGGHLLWNGCFIKLHVSKARRLPRIRFEAVESPGA